MILMSAKAIKILLIGAVLLVNFLMFHKRLSRHKVLCLFILTIIFALFANKIASFTPSLTDQVILTALGENREEAMGQEVYLAGYTIDGKDFNSLDFLDIEEGHWFWSGESYSWRPETDKRQPEGVTRTVILNIPVGWSRSLNFSGNPYRGIVQIQAGGRTWSVDTYSEGNSVKSEWIEKSETSALILNQIRHLAVYAAVLLALSVLAVILTRVAVREPEASRIWMKEHSGRLIYGGIAIITFFLMFHYAGRFSFWLDEMYQISFVKDSLAEAFECCLKLLECSPPLALICSAAWYRIAPYGEQWLLLMSMLLTALSIYVIGLIGERIRNNYCGILAATMMAFSTTVWLNAAYEYRAYPYFLMFSTLTLYFYIRKNDSNRPLRCAVAFSVSLTCLAMTHYFGLVACAAYFLGDLFLWYKKQVKWKEGFLFVLPGVCSIGWLLAVASYQRRVFVSDLQWFPIPSISNIKEMLMFLTGNTEFFYWILWFSIANCIAHYLQDKQDRRQSFNWPAFYQRFFSCELVITIAFMFVYGVYINPKSTLWSERYFMFLLPSVITLLAMALHDLSAWLENHGTIVKKTTALFVGLILSLNCLALISSSTSQSLSSFGNNMTRTSSPYREAADWLYQQSNYIFNDTTLIITTRNDKTGWIEYYITRQGRRDNLNIFEQGEINQDEALKYNRIYIQSVGGGAAASWLQTLLNNNYTLEANYNDIKVSVFTRNG